MVFGTLFLLIFVSSFFNPTAALPLTTASSLRNTTDVPSNSSAESQSVDGLQIHSALSNSLQVGPPYAQIDQANSTNNDNISPQQSSNDTRSKTDDLNEDADPLMGISVSRWVDIPFEANSIERRFANISRSFYQCPSFSRTFSRWLSHLQRYKIRSDETDGALCRETDILYRLLLCVDMFGMTGFFDALNSTLSQTYEVAPRWGWRNDRKLLQAKQELASHLLEDSKRGVRDPMSFQHCKNPADVKALASKSFRELYYADLYDNDEYTDDD